MSAQLLTDDIDRDKLPPVFGKLKIVAEFLYFLRHSKKWWLTPIVLVLLGVSALIVFTESSALAPFIYSLF